MLETVGVSETNYKGDGTVIAVIDNSFDRYHEFLSLSEGTEGRLTKEDVINISPYLSASLKNGVDYYVNNKIPYAFNYCSQTTDTLKDFHTHGTQSQELQQATVKLKPAANMIRRALLRTHSSFLCQISVLAMKI